MNKRRLFIAINLPERAKKRLIDYQKKWTDLDPNLIRWVKKDNLHITLVFIGYVTDDEMYEIINTVKEVVKKHDVFMIDFEKIILGPKNKTPRMFWLEGKEDKKFTNLQNDLNEAITNVRGKVYHQPHVTLARFKYPLLKSLPKQVDDEFKAQIPLETIEVMQSNLKRTGAEYSVLESIELGS